MKEIEGVDVIPVCLAFKSESSGVPKPSYKSTSVLVTNVARTWQVLQIPLSLVHIISHRPPPPRKVTKKPLRVMIPLFLYEKWGDDVYNYKT